MADLHRKFNDIPIPMVKTIPMMVDPIPMVAMQYMDA